MLGGDRLAWRMGANRLRILCYHGVCEDRLAGEPWVPLYFVTQSAFERQLRYLKGNARVLPLADAIARLQEGSLPPRSVSLTFDDGYANNLELAQPLLARHGMSATVFLSSAYIETGELYPFLKLKLIRLSAAAGRPIAAEPLLDYKSAPLDTVMERAAPWWESVRSSLTAEQRRFLRPLTIDEVLSADPEVIEFGAHSHTHCILSNESPERRQREIRISVDKVRQWSGRPVRLFSYPNGEHGDFGETDKEALRAEGVEAAVTGIGGANSTGADPFALRRYPITISHDECRFRAEVTGFRAALQNMSLGRAS